MDEIVRHVAANGVELEVGLRGEGRDTVLVHGFPHTRALWDRVAPALADGGRRVITPDLRGFGGSTRAVTGYDAQTLADDLVALFAALDADEVDLVAIDAGVAPAFLAALRYPGRVRRLVLVEATLGRLPGAEDFFARGAPWWFGFHAVPGLAERVLVGHEADYLDFFYRSGTYDGRGIDADIRDRFVRAYERPDSLRCAFETYRAFPETGRQLADAVAQRRLTVPTLAVGARPVGDALYRQLCGVADDVQGELVEDCGHLVPLDRPDRLVGVLGQFLL